MEEWKKGFACALWWIGAEFVPDADIAPPVQSMPRLPCKWLPGLNLFPKIWKFNIWEGTLEKNVIDIKTSFSSESGD